MKVLISPSWGSIFQWVGKKKKKNIYIALTILLWGLHWDIWEYQLLIIILYWKPTAGGKPLAGNAWIALHLKLEFLAIWCPFFFSHSGMLTALRGLPLPPSHSHVPSAASRGVLEIGCAGKFWGHGSCGGSCHCCPLLLGIFVSKKSSKFSPFSPL